MQRVKPVFHFRFTFTLMTELKFGVQLLEEIFGLLISTRAVLMVSIKSNAP